MDLVAELRKEIAERIELDALEERIATYVARIDAFEHELLTGLREFDARQGWVGRAKSCARWLSWRTGLSMQAARERVRVARALGGLPRIDEAMARGELSYSKVRALTRVATPQTESKWIERARRVPADHLESICRERRHGTRAAVRTRADRRFVRRRNTPHGMVRIEIQLAPAEAEVVWDAIMAATEGTPARDATSVVQVQEEDARGDASAEAASEVASAIGAEVGSVDAVEPSRERAAAEDREEENEASVGPGNAGGQESVVLPNPWAAEAEEALRAVHAELRAAAEAKSQPRTRADASANDPPGFEELRADAIVAIAESFMRLADVRRRGDGPRPP